MAPYGLVVLYRNLYSRYATPRCRFYPSCSQYAMDMLKEKGFFRGIHKIIWRILRCNPFNEGGYDPVK
ncbi:MAG: membrane protein insertion efficiency factor YidD [Proteobacteria bacterium]|nr:membrane protein insertion efficiency factor YidD [Pseudomonadota bacterium]